MNYIGDNFQAFDGQPITVELEFEEDGQDVSKAEAIFNCGALCKHFDAPVFPIKIEINEEDSKKLSLYNEMRLVVWDNKGRRKQCDGVLKFKMEKGVFCAS